MTQPENGEHTEKQGKQFSESLTTTCIIAEDIPLTNTGNNKENVFVKHYEQYNITEFHSVII